MAGAVVKYKPEKVDKMMRIAQASALDVSLFAIRASLPIGGLLWMFSNNFLLFELSFLLVPVAFLEKRKAVKRVKRLQQSAHDMVAAAEKRYDLSMNDLYWVNEWHQPIFAILDPVVRKVLIGSVWSGEWELHDFSWIQRWESAAEKSYSYAGSSSGSIQTQYSDSITRRSSGSYSSQEYGVSVQGYDAPRVVLWVDDLSQPSRVLYVPTMHDAQEWCARIKLMLVDGRKSV